MSAFPRLDTEIVPDGAADLGVVRVTPAPALEVAAREMPQVACQTRALTMRRVPQDVEATGAAREGMARTGIANHRLQFILKTQPTQRALKCNGSHALALHLVEQYLRLRVTLDLPFLSTISSSTPLLHFTYYTCNLNAHREILVLSGCDAFCTQRVHWVRGRIIVSAGIWSWPAQSWAPNTSSGWSQSA